MINFSQRNRKVAIQRWNKIFCYESNRINKNSLFFPELKARLIGYLMGDGFVSIRRAPEGEHYELGFFPDDKSMLDAFLDAFIKIYNTKPSIKKEEKYFIVRKKSKPIVADLSKYGSFKSLEWNIPKYTRSSEKREWLSAFFDCEAYVGKNQLVVQSVNQNGLIEVKKLLSEFGIASSLYSYRRRQKNWNINYLLHIRGDNRRRFLKEIGFNHKVKQEKLMNFAGVA